jgi:crotonobetainyl-CoA:carnitine CoA-transferase CaiB-like acyl-CoA transferase
VERRAPKVGENNVEVYSELLNFTTRELFQLEAEGAI